MSLFQELKRRNVFRVAAAYVVVAWLILQVGETLAPALHLPDTVNSVLVFFLLLGFPLALFFAWAFELTPDGLKKEKDVDRSKSITDRTARKLDRNIIVLLVIALGYFVWTSQFREAQQTAEPSVNIPMTASLASLVEVPDSSKQSIAVLPFVNMSSDEEQEYFSDGLSEELLNLLAKIPDLRVASRTSAFSYKGKDIRISDIGAELNVANVLEGSVRKSGTTIRITAQLIDVDTDTHLWSETWDRSMDDVFAIQDEIAKAVADQLRIELFDAPPTVVETSPEAYALVLQARHHARRRSTEGFARAESLLNRALAIDPQYAPAWALLGRIYQFSGAIEIRSPLDAEKLAREAALKALELDPDNTPALTLLGTLAISNEYDYEAAVGYISRALSVNPDDFDAQTLASGIAMIVGDYETGQKLGRAMSQRDPLSNIALINLGYSAYFAGNYDEAIRSFERVLELTPDSVSLHYYVACVMIQQGRLDEAETRLNLEALDGFRHTGLAILHHLRGDRAASDAELAKLNELGVDWAYQRLMVYAQRGENDKAMDWFETAIEIRDRGLNLVVGDPILDPIRDDPRFNEFLARMNRTPIR